MSYNNTGVGFIMDLYSNVGAPPEEAIEEISKMLVTNTACEPYRDDAYPHVVLYREKNLDKSQFFASVFYDRFVEQTKLRVINFPGRCGWTLLGVCAQKGRVELAKWVLKNGGNPDYCNDRGESMKEIAKNAEISEEAKKEFENLV